KSDSTRPDSRGEPMPSRPALALFLPCALLMGLPVAAQDKPVPPPAVRVDAAPAQGFHWAYYLHVPAKLREGPKDAPRTFLVLPNNTGQPDDDSAAHDRYAKRFTEGMRPWADQLGVALLMPTFPRPKKD